jgi:hypothetical protein
MPRPKGVLKGFRGPVCRRCRKAEAVVNAWCSDCYEQITREKETKDEQS